MSAVTGWAIAIRRPDGSLFMSLPGEGIATKVWLARPNAVARAKEMREHRLDAVVVKVEYVDPKIVGPARFVGRNEP